MDDRAEYFALKQSYKRLHDDYEELEQSCKKVEKSKQKYIELSRQLAERDEYIERLEVRIRAIQKVAEIKEPEIIKHVEQLESQILKCNQHSNQLKIKIEKKTQEIEKLKSKIDEMEQWTSYLQSLCDERLSRIKLLEQKFPFLSFVYLIRLWFFRRKK